MNETTWCPFPSCILPKPILQPFCLPHRVWLRQQGYVEAGTYVAHQYKETEGDGTTGNNQPWEQPA